jgi:tetratricopeptide (TPR) repeat protein
LFPLAAVVFFAVFFWLRHRARAPLAAFLFFGGTLFPVLGFVNVYPFIYSFVADHFQYLASISVIALAAAGIALLLKKYELQQHVAGYAIPLLLLLSLGVLTWRESRMYQDPETLYRTTLERNPDSWMAHVNLGIELANKQQLKEAISHYERALAIEPNNPQAYTNLGNIFTTQGRTREAVANYEKTIAISPHSMQPLNNLAWLEATSADPAVRNPVRALSFAESAMKESRGSDPVVLRTLAATYAANERFEDAARTAEEAAQLARDHPEWASKLANEAKLYRAHHSLGR